MVHLDYVGKVTQSASSDNGFEKGDCKNLLTEMDVFYLVFLYVFINQNVMLIVTLLFFKDNNSYNNNSYNSYVF